MSKIYKLAASIALAVLSVTALLAQDASPDTSVIDVALADRDSAKRLLKDYQPTFGDDGRPEYYFYNEFANQVIRFVADSWEDKYLITEIEVFAVTDKYRNPHFQLKDVGYFKTNNGLFIGYKQSATSLLSAFTIGVQDPGGKNRVREGRVQKLFGEPDETVEEGERATLIYKKTDMKLKDIEGAVSYRASYEFRKGKLKKMVFTVKSDE